jgi:hypothetical protein
VHILAENLSRCTERKIKDPIIKRIPADIKKVSRIKSTVMLFFCSSIAEDALNAVRRAVTGNLIEKYASGKKGGYSIRCLKDFNPENTEFRKKN